MNLRQIEVFRAVMNTGLTTEAARLLHVSQPGISRLIRHLEVQLGVALFERRRGRLVPTAEARELHEEVERVYRGVQHVRDVAAHLRFGATSTLRILSSANVALELVPRGIARLVQQFPAARVLFESVSVREVVKLLVSEEADLAISSAPLDHPVLESTVIGHWQLLCAIPLEHELLRQRRPRLGTALKGRWIAYSPEAPQSAAINQWLESHALARNVAVEVRSGLAACAVAAAGVGIAFVDDLSARAHKGEGLAFASIRDTPRFPIYLVRNRHRLLSRLGDGFSQIVTEELAAIQSIPVPVGRLQL